MRSDTSTALDPITASTPLARYLAMTQGLLRCRRIGSATVSLRGRATDCDVVQADYEVPAGMQAKASPTTFWIEKGRHVVLRESVSVHFTNQEQMLEMKQVLAYSRASVDEPLPDSLFTFRPPPGAQR